MHEEHRKRLRNRFISEGLDNFEPHNVLEILLFYSIPRRDTNEIAHRLIDKYGSLSAVLEADVQELTKIEGVGENSAVLLNMIPQLTRRYMLEKRTVYKAYDSIKKAGDFLVPYFIGQTSEIVYLMLLDSSFRLLDCSLLFRGSVNSAHITTRELIERALSVHATMAVLAHNHPTGAAIPSESDIATTLYVLEALRNVDVRLLEHFVVAGDTYTPIMSRSANSFRDYLHDENLHTFYTGSTRASDER